MIIRNIRDDKDIRNQKDKKVGAALNSSIKSDKIDKYSLSLIGADTSIKSGGLN
jgi:hypothetical protein